MASKPNANICVVNNTFNSRGGIQAWANSIGRLLQNNGYNLHKMEISKGLGGKLKSLISTFVERKCDIYIVMNMRFLLYVLIPVAFYRKKAMVVFHGDELIKVNPFFKGVVRFFSKREGVEFIANSNYTKKYAAEHLNVSEEKIKVINPFSSYSEAIDKSKSENRQSAACTCLNILTLTRLVKRKNILNGLEAIRQLTHEGYSLHYKIAGEGELVEKIVKYKNDNNLSNVEVLGSVGDNEKENLYLESDVFLLPSITIKDSSFEGYGIVYIEANSYGVPVISGNAGGAAEAVINGVTGLHTDGCVKEIKDSLKCILDNKIKFLKEELYQHAIQHDIDEQSSFVEIINRLSLIK